MLLCIPGNIVGIDQIAIAVKNIDAGSIFMVLFFISDDTFKNRFALLGCFNHTHATFILIIKGSVQGNKPLVIGGCFCIFSGTVGWSKDFFFPSSSRATSIHSSFEPSVFLTIVEMPASRTYPENHRDLPDLPSARFRKGK